MNVTERMRRKIESLGLNEGKLMKFAHPGDHTLRKERLLALSGTCGRYALRVKYPPTDVDTRSIAEMCSRT